MTARKANKPKGRAVDGILILNKPLGISSNHALQQAKRLFNAAKAGHTGSLDPAASGLLPICFGEATKFSQFLLDANKAYRSEFTFGVCTDSGDADGQVVDEADASTVSEIALREVLKKFVGPIEQVPPMYSALKHQGQPLYKLARQGQVVDRKARSVQIHALDLLSFTAGVHATAEVQVSCSKGTYIRTLAEDIGAQLDCGAHVSALHRTVAQPFEQSQMHSFDTLTQLAADADYQQLDKLLLPVDAGIQHLPALQADEAQVRALRYGQQVWLGNDVSSGLVRVMLRGAFIGVARVADDGYLKPQRLLSY